MIRILFLLFYCWGHCLTQPFVEAANPAPHRFASLRSRLVNMHIGPGVQYAVSWQFLQVGLPVEIVGEFEHWRQVKDTSGTKGWIHKSLLCGKRTVYVLHDHQSLHQNPDEKSRVLAYLQTGVIGKVVNLQGDWCCIKVTHPQVGQYKGWVLRRHVFGLYSHEMHL